MNTIQKSNCQKYYFTERNLSKRKIRSIIMKITVCIGSSCHIKGSRQVVERLQYLISQNGLDDKVELSGTFCMGKCQHGVCVTVDDDFYSVTPDTADEFFEKNVKGALK